MTAHVQASARHDLLHKPDWVTIATAAERLGLSTKSVRRRIADGTLPAYRIGPRLIRLDSADVDRLLPRRIPAA
ncbi:MAG: helix-turn-helix transcriptional regulator [Trebonia sp.]